MPMTPSDTIWKNLSGSTLTTRKRSVFLNIQPHFLVPRHLKERHSVEWDLAQPS
jgi:hypothetical protein